MESAATMFNDKDDYHHITFFQDGTWADERGNAGHYTLEGSQLAIRGPMGGSMATIEGDRFVMQDGNAYRLNK